MEEERIGAGAEPQALELVAPPDGVGRHGHRRRVARIGVAIVIATLGLLVVAAGSEYAYLFAKGFVVFGSRVWTSPMQHTVAWAGNGDWLVAQLRDRDGRAVAAAWSPKSGTTRTLKDYRTVAINEFEPVIMVAWDPGHSLFEIVSAPLAQREAFAKEYTAMGKATDFLDDPVAGGVSRWDLRTGELLPSVARGAWGAWTGTGGGRVSMDFDASRGAWPSALHFESDGRPAVLAAEPGSTGTVIPMGWTADGSAFAVVRCVSADRTSVAMDATSAPAAIETAVSLLSTVDGSVLASTTVWAGPFDAVSAHVALDPSRGEIVVLSGSHAWENRLLSLTASEGVRPITLPPRADAATPTAPVWLLGYDGEGVSFTTARSAKPVPAPRGVDRGGVPWAVWSIRGTSCVWSTWMRSLPPQAFDRRQGIAWIHVSDYPEAAKLPGIFPDPVTGTEDVMWSPKPTIPPKRVMRGYYSFVF